MPHLFSPYWADYSSSQLRAVISACARPQPSTPEEPASDHAAATASTAVSDSALTVVLPLGATEQHGPHLPLHTDSSIAEAVIAAAIPHLQRAATPALFLPLQTVGLSPEHTAFTGTLSLQPQTCLQLWTDIGRCAAQAGVRKLLLFNAHGGNTALMEVVARQLRVETGMFTAFSSWHQLPLGDAGAAFDAQEWRYGIHAGAIETAVMQHLRPELTGEAGDGDKRLQRFSSSSQWRSAHTTLLGDGKSCKIGWAMQDYNALGAAGDATQASAEKGQALVAAAGASLAALLAEISDLPLHCVMQQQPVYKA